MQKLILKTAIIEECLIVYKTAIYHELKLQNLEVCNQMPETTSKQRYEKKTAIKDVIAHFEKQIRKCQGNNEISVICKKNTPKLTEFVDIALDKFADLTESIINDPTILNK